MACNLIVAYGNPWRGDDGLAWGLAGRLRAAGLPPGTTLRVCRQLTPEMADEIRGARRVIFVDAACRGRPGDLLRQPLEGPAPPLGGGHHLTPAQLLELAASLGRGAPPAVLLSMVGQRFPHRPGLSPAVRRNLSRLADAVRRELAAPPTRGRKAGGGRGTHSNRREDRMRFQVGKTGYVPGTYPSQKVSRTEMTEQHFHEWQRRHRRAAKPAPARPLPLTICFSRKVGVGALEIADRLAKRIGYRVCDREILEHIAAHGELSEKTVALFDERYPGKVAEFMAFVTAEKSFIKSDYARLLSRIVFAVAGVQPTIFVGRGTHLILPRDRVLAVRFIASRLNRVLRLAGMLRVPEAEASRLVDEMDREQRSYFRKVFGKKDAPPEEFDLVLNLDYIQDPQAAADIVALAFRRRKAEVEARPAAA